MSILCLAVLGIYSGSNLGSGGHAIFRSTVVYTYAFSLIFIGIIQLVTTRYLADRFYEKKTDTTLSTFLTCTILVLAGGTLFSTLWYSFFEISFLHKLFGIIFFLVVNMIWLCMIFISAIKDYLSIVYAFAAGSLLSIFAALKLGPSLGTEGYLLGYLLGQALILFWILARLMVEFPSAKLWDRDFTSHFRKFWDLMLIGFVFNLAIWADKFVFWIAPDARLIIPWFKTHDLYEGPVFLSYLTIVPTLALFLLKMETRFYEHYKSYYGKIIGKKSMATILQEKDLMIGVLKESMREVLIIQGGITFLCLVFTPGLAKMANLVPLQIPLLRITLIGAFLQVLLSINIIILFYFDQRRCVLAVTMLFLASNAGFSFLSTRLGIQFYGYGYTYACLISLLLAFYLLNTKVRDLEYITFSEQPVL
jgi:uncharacterized membrane protein